MIVCWAEDTNLQSPLQVEGVLGRCTVSRVLRGQPSSSYAPSVFAMDDLKRLSKKVACSGIGGTF